MTTEQRLSFENANLRFNPFGELLEDDRKTVACVNIDGLAKYLEQDRACIQFVADHGRGKTTHLLALHEQCAEFPFIRLHIDEKPQFKIAHQYFIDSIENLPFLHRVRVYCRYKKLVITTHRNLSNELKLFGFKVKTVIVSTTHTDQLATLFQKRIEHARRTEGPVPTISTHHIKKLQHQHGDDVRAMENELYDYYEMLRTKHGQM